jgi:hypothetical protein
VETLGKVLIALAVLLAVVGALLLLFSRLGVDRVPGDIVYRRPNVTVYVPLGTMILVSIVLTIVLNLLFRR